MEIHQHQNNSDDLFITQFILGEESHSITGYRNSNHVIRTAKFFFRIKITNINLIKQHKILRIDEVLSVLHPMSSTCNYDDAFSAQNQYF